MLPPGGNPWLDPRACIRLDLTKRVATVLYNVVTTARYAVDPPPGAAPLPAPTDQPWGPTSEAEVLDWVGCCLYVGILETRGNGL